MSSGHTSSLRTILKFELGLSPRGGVAPPDGNVCFRPLCKLISCVYTDFALDDALFIHLTSRHVNIYTLLCAGCAFFCLTYFLWLWCINFLEYVMLGFDNRSFDGLSMSSVLVYSPSVKVFYSLWSCKWICRKE